MKNKPKKPKIRVPVPKPTLVHESRSERRTEENKAISEGLQDYLDDLEEIESHLQDKFGI